MAQIIQPQPTSLSETLGAGLGQGLGQGLAGGMQSALELAMKHRLQQQQMGMLSQALGLGTPQGQTGIDQTQERHQYDTTMTSSSQQDRVSQIATNPQAMMALESINPQAAMMIQKMHESRVSQSNVDKKLAFTETKNLREGIDQGYKNYQETSRILNKMSDLNKPGKLAGPWKAHLAEVTGIPLAALSNPESEEFQKLSQNLMKGVTQYGSKVLQVEFQNFMKQIPTLLNSEEGRKRIINNMKIMLEPSKLEYEAKKQIIKENGGIPPLDLNDQIQERVADQFQQGAQKFETQSIEAKEGFSTLPPAKEYEGRVITDKATGKKYKAVNGKWQIQ